MTRSGGEKIGTKKSCRAVSLPICLILLFSFGTLRARAEKPTFLQVYPVAVARGTSNNITLSGTFDPWPPKVWASSPGLEFTFKTNKGGALVNVSMNAETGPKLLRLYNDEGASDPIIFLVSDTQLISDTEPNNYFAKPQLLTNFPANISGRLEKNNDVDSFGFRVKAGQWLDAQMESHVLMSKLDGVLRLVTRNGYQLAWNHDFSSFDPRLVWRAPQDQNVVLQTFGFLYPANAEIQLSGGSGGIYLLRLALSDHPPADLTQPLCEQSRTNTLPLEVYGAICPAGDEDSYPLELKKDDFIEARVDATSFGSPLDPWVAIRNSEDKELARNDDAEGSRDARLEWKVPADGIYSVRVGSVTHQGSESWRYRLRVIKALPDYTATLSVSAFVLEPTGTNDVKVATKRLRGFTNELSVALENLPEGVTAEPVKSAEKSGEVTLKLVSKDAPAFNGPIRIVLKDTANSEERSAMFELVSRGENNGVPQGYSKLLIEQTDQLWLTVKPKPEKK
jgi:hypothetical protein